MVLGSGGGAVVLMDNVVGRMLRGEVGDVELGGDVELRSGSSMEQGGRKPAPPPTAPAEQRYGAVLQASECAHPARARGWLGCRGTDTATAAHTSAA